MTNLLQTIDDELSGDAYFQGVSRAEDEVRVVYDRLTYAVALVGNKVGVTVIMNGHHHSTPFCEMMAGRLQLLLDRERLDRLLGMTPKQAMLVGEALTRWAVGQEQQQRVASMGGVRG